ncbi:hypothetical protein [Carp edema virus]|nr:hypothetical protein [Carp edema virus]
MSQYTIIFKDSVDEEQRVTLKTGIYPTFWVDDVLTKISLLEKVPLHVKNKYKSLFSSDLDSDSKFPSFILSLEEYVGVENCKYFVFSPSETKLLWFMFYDNKFCTKQTIEHINERVANRNKNDPEEMAEDDEDVISVLTKSGEIAKVFGQKFSPRLGANKYVDFMQAFLKAINEFFRRVSLHLVFEFANDESIFSQDPIEIEDTSDQTASDVEEILVQTKSTFVPVDSRNLDLEQMVLTQSRKLQEQNREILSKDKEIRELENKLGNAFSDFLEVATKHDELEKELEEVKKQKSEVQTEVKTEVDPTLQKQIDFWKNKVAELRTENAGLKIINNKLQEKIDFPE